MVNSSVINAIAHKDDVKKKHPKSLREKLKWVWAWVPVFDDFVDGFIPAYQVLSHRPDEHTDREE